MRSALQEQLTYDWDAIVLDHYGSAWMLAAVSEYARRKKHKVTIAHVSHNFEQKLALALLRANKRGLARAIILFQNFLKIRFWERRIASAVNICTSITDEDSKDFSSIAPNTQFLTLSPGYSGRVTPHRVLDQSTLRGVVLIGSYRWGVKELNLRELLDAADGPFARAGISLEIIGDVPEGVLRDYQNRLASCHFHGFVDDYSPFLDKARIALVPEIVGGGFKLKFLDYIFSGMPVATIAEASAGLSAEIRNNFILAHDMNDLVHQVISSIDNLPMLNQMRSQAYSAARLQFAWADRGALLRNTLFEAEAKVRI